MFSWMKWLENPPQIIGIGWHSDFGWMYNMDEIYVIIHLKPQYSNDVASGALFRIWECSIIPKHSTKTYVHSNLHNINLLNVSPSLISWNPSEWLLLI